VNFKDNEDLIWLDQILNKSEPTDKETNFYLCQPSIKSPEFLLPIDNPPATASSLYRFSDDKKVSKRIKTFSAYSLAKLRFLKHKPELARVGIPIELPKWDITTFLEKELGEPQLVATITIGPPRRNRKPVIQLLKPDGETVGFAKIGWSPLTKELTNNEADILEKLHNKLDKNISAPRVLLNKTWNNNSVLVISPVNSSPISRRGSIVPSKIFKQISTSLGTQIKPFQEVPIIENKKISKIINVKKLVNLFDNTDILLGTWHGDLTPWNISTTFSTTSIWDWEFAGENTPVGFDQLHCEFELMRRNPEHSPTQSLENTKSRAPELLKTITDNSEAIFYLYVCELIRREQLLADQRWNPESMLLLPSLIEFLQKYELKAK